jgi:hypothetical protein
MKIDTEELIFFALKEKCMTSVQLASLLDKKRACISHSVAKMAKCGTIIIVGYDSQAHSRIFGIGDTSFENPKIIVKKAKTGDAMFPKQKWYSPLGISL